MKNRSIIKKSISLAFVLLLGVFSLTACTGDRVLKKDEDLLYSVEVSSAVPKYNFTQEEASVEGYSTYSEKLTDFSLSLLKSSYKGENLLIPTLSQHQTLALLLNGASGKTASELKKVISPNMDLQTLNTCNYYLQSRVSYFNTEDSGYFADSSLWFDDLFDVKSSFTQSAKNYYSCTLARLLINTEDAQDKINRNTELVTNGSFEKVLDAPLENQAIYAQSAATLKDAWAVPYTADRVSVGTFEGKSGSAHVNFMTSNEKYVETEMGEGFVKSLKNTPIKFAAITPKENCDMEALIDSLNYNRIKTMLLESDPTAFCTVSFPEFAVSQTASYDDVLRQMGALQIYTEDANFSSLTNGKGAVLSSSLTASSIEVSATGISNSGELEAEGDTLKETERTLNFQKPFIYIFFDNESAVPLFIGVINNVE